MDDCRIGQFLADALLQIHRNFFHAAFLLMPVLHISIACDLQMIKDNVCYDES